MQLDVSLFLQGFFTGLVAVVGLGLGVRILFSTSDPEKNLSKGVLVQRYLLSGIILTGQFILAAYLLTRGKSRETLSENLSLGLGLIVSIFITALAAIPFFNKNLYLFQFLD